MQVGVNLSDRQRFVIGAALLYLSLWILVWATLRRAESIDAKLHREREARRRGQEERRQLHQQLEEIDDAVTDDVDVDEVLEEDVGDADDQAREALEEIASEGVEDTVDEVEREGFHG